MKRIFTVLSIFIIALTLSACDQFGLSDDSGIVDDIKDKVEDFCTENPDDLLCTEEAINEVQGSGFENFIKEIISDYSNKSETFCEDYFAITNNALYTSCETTIEDIIPSDFIGYEYQGMKDISTEEDTIYTFSFTNLEVQKVYQFNVTFTQIDGTLLVKEWTYKLEDLDYNSLTVSEKDALAVYQSFLDDYLDPTLESDYICSLYNFPLQLIENCSLNRDTSFIEGLSLEIASHELLDNGNIKIYLNVEANGETEVQEDILQFFYSYNGEIEFVFIIDEPIIDEDEELDNIEDILYQSTLEIYQGSDKETILNNYYYESDDFIDFYEIINDSDNFGIQSVDFSEGTYIASFFLAHGDTISYISFGINPVYENEKLYLDVYFLDTKPESIFDELEDFVVEFITEFNSRTIDFNQLTTYFDGGTPAEIVEAYQENEIINSFHFDNDDETLYLVFVLDSSQLWFEVTTTKVDDTLIVELDFVKEIVNHHTEESLFTQMMYEVAYAFSTGTTDTIEHYFTEDSFFFIQDEFLSTGSDDFDVWISYIADDYFIVAFQYDSTEYGKAISFELNTEGNFSALSVFEVVNSSLQQEITINEVNTFLDMILMDYDASTICDTVSQNNQTNCLELIDIIRSNDHTLINHINTDYNNTYFILNFYDEDMILTSQLLVHIDLTTNELDYENYYDFDITSIETIETVVNLGTVSEKVEEIATNFNNSNIDSVDVCESPDNILISCSTMRFGFQEQGLSLIIKSISNQVGTNIFDIEFAVITSDGVEYGFTDAKAIFYYDETGILHSKIVYFNPFSFNSSDYSSVIVPDNIDELISAFFMDLSNEEISNLDLMNKYSTIDVYGFIEVRDTFLESEVSSIDITVTSSDSYNISLTLNRNEGIETLYYKANIHVYDDHYEISFFVDSQTDIKNLLEELEDNLNVLLNDNENSMEEIHALFITNDIEILIEYANVNGYHFEVNFLDSYFIYEVLVMDSSNEMIKTVYINPDYYNDLTGTQIVQMDLSLSQLFDETNDAQLLVEALSNGGITLDEFCSELDCGELVPLQYESFTVSTHSFGHYQEEDYVVKIVFMFDGEERIGYYTIVTKVEDYEIVQSFELIAIKIAPQGELTIVDLETASIVATDFIYDVFNQDISNEYLEDTYFNGYVNEQITLFDRSDMIETDITFEIVTIERSDDADGNFKYFEIIANIGMNGEIEEGSLELGIYILEDGNYYIVLH